MSFFKLLKISCCALLLLASVLVYFVYTYLKAFEEIGEALDGFGINYLYSIETHFNNNEKKYNKIDSVAQNIIHSNHENILNDSAKQILKSLITELFPHTHDSSIYFYSKMFQIKKYKSVSQPDSMKTCYWGYAWMPVFIDNSENEWVWFNKIYEDYSTAILIYKWYLPKDKGWYFYREGCY